MEDENYDDLRDTVASLTAELASLQEQLSRVTGPYDRIFMAKDGDADGEFKEWTANAGDLVEFTDGREGEDLIDPVPDDVYFVMELTDYDGGVAKKSFVKIQTGGGVFPVDLEMDGGADGDQSHTPTWTYTALDPNPEAADPELGTGLTPDWGRAMGKRTAATGGLGYYDYAGTFKIAIAYEIDGVVACVGAE